MIILDEEVEMRRVRGQVTRIVRHAVQDKVVKITTVTTTRRYSKLIPRRSESI